jgi:hypothetical protein
MNRTSKRFSKKGYVDFFPYIIGNGCIVVTMKMCSLTTGIGKSLIE